MKIEISDDVLAANNWSEKDLLIELACMLYERTDFSWNAGTRMTGLSREDFLRELGKRKIAFKYTIADLEQDMKNLSTLNDSGQ